jgi:hypothetical protein
MRVDVVVDAIPELSRVGDADRHQPGDRGLHIGGDSGAQQRAGGHSPATQL